MPWTKVGNIRGPMPSGITDVSALTTAADVNAATLAAGDGAIIWFGNKIVPLVVEDTILLRPRQIWWGGFGRGQLTKIQAGPSFPAGKPLVAAVGYMNSSAYCDNPVKMSGFNLDCNGKTGSHGLVVYNFWSEFRDIQVFNCAGIAAHGVHVTDKGYNGSTVTTNSHSENVFENLRFSDFTNLASAFWAESNNGYSNQDGHLRNSFFASIGGFGIRLGRAAGWSVVDNHMYGIGFDAISASGCYATKIQSNYIEDFGAQNAASPGDPTYGYYNGIAATILDTRATIISGNTVSILSERVTGQRFTCYYVTAGSGQTKAKCVLEGNAAVWASSSAPSTLRGRAYDLDCPSNASLEIVYGDNLLENTTWWQTQRVTAANVNLIESYGQRASGIAHARDEVVYGDIYAPFDRFQASVISAMSGGFITASGIIVPRKMKVSKFRMAVQTAGAYSTAPSVSCKIMGGTSLTSLATLATVPVAATTYTSRGMKELALSTAIQPEEGMYLFAVWWFAATWSTTTGLAGATMLDVIINPDTTRDFQMYRSSSSDQASPMNATSGWAAPTGAITQPWWALAA